METRQCWNCQQPYFVTDNGAYSHSCPDGSMHIAGTSFEAVDFYAELEDITCSPNSK